MGRVLGIDFGTRRIGTALSDPTGTIASPHVVLTRRPGKRPPWTDLLALLAEHEVTEVVIGLPIGLDGEEGEWAAEVRHFGDALTERTGLPVHWLDERFTSALAEQAIRASGLSRSQRADRSRVDRAAAAILLQAHLDRRGPRPTPAADA